MTGRRRALGALVALALLAACSDDEHAEPAPRPGVTTSTTVPVDRSGIDLAPVAGETTTTIRQTGTARLVGEVRGPRGLVPGATVRVERLVADRVISTDVVTGADGRFVLDQVPGGRYRVRAFLPPTLAQIEPEVRFLVDGEEHAFDLVVEAHTGLVVQSSVAPDPVLLDHPVNLVVQIAERVVDGDGVVRAQPQAGLVVELEGLGRWVLRDDGPDVGDDGGGTPFWWTTTTTSPRREVSERTDGAGRVAFELLCQVTGTPGLAVRVPVAEAPSAPAVPDATGTSTTTTVRPSTRLDTVVLELPACIDPATTTTTTTATTAPPASGEG